MNNDTGKYANAVCKHSNWIEVKNQCCLECRPVQLSCAHIHSIMDTQCNIRQKRVRQNSKSNVVRRRETSWIGDGKFSTKCTAVSIWRFYIVCTILKVRKANKSIFFLSKSIISMVADGSMHIGTSVHAITCNKLEWKKKKKKKNEENLEEKTIGRRCMYDAVGNKASKPPDHMDNSYGRAVSYMICDGIDE